MLPEIGPRTEAVRAVMADLLDTANFPADGDFLAAGGDSLRAMKVVNRLLEQYAPDDEVLADELQADLLVALFDGATPKVLADLLPTEPRPRPRSRSGRSALAAATVEPDDGVLSYPEERLWAVQAVRPDNAAYNIVNLFEVTGDLKPEALTRALTALADRHAPLRTRLDPAAPVPAKVVDAAARVDAAVTEPFTSLDEAVAEAHREAARPFDLPSRPPVRMRVYPTGDRRWLVLFVIHHSAADGASMETFYGELAALYDGSAPLGTLGASYAEFAAGQRATDHDQQVGWWQGYLEPLPPRLDLDVSCRRPNERTFAGDVVRDRVAPEVVAAVQALAERSHTTFFAVLMAAFQVAVHRRSRQERFLVGTVAAARGDPGYDGLVGFFANTIPIVADLSGDLGFTDLVKRVSTQSAHALAHQATPFELIARAQHEERDASRAPLLDAVLILQDRHPLLELGGCRARTVPIHNRTAKFDLTLEATPTADGLELVWEHATDVVDRAAADDMARTFVRVLEQAASDPHVGLAELTALTPAELARYSTADGRGEVDGRHDLARMFRERVAARPADPAVHDGGRTVTFRELDLMSRRAATQLRAIGARRGDLVGIMMPRSAATVAALIGVLRAGCPFVLLDPSYPAAFRRQVVHHSGMRYVVVDGEPDVDLPAEVRAVAAPGADGPLDDEPDAAMAPDEVAYLVYTSGSTGRPKAVVGLHRSLEARCRWAWETYPYAPGDVASHRTPLSFVDAISEVVVPLWAGVPVVVVPDDVGSDTTRLLRILHASGVTRLLTTPSLLRALLDNHDDVAERLARLDLCTVSGEMLTPDLVGRFTRALPHTRLLNLYGASETGGDTTWFEASGATSDGAVPIGRPLHGSAVHIVDGTLTPVPPGVPGELVVTGACLAAGYLHDPELTAERFVTLTVDGSPRPAFRTGDIGYLGDDGQLTLLGRRDRQVKVRGCRVDLEHVEGVLTEVDGIRESAVLAVGPAHATKLVAYVTAESQGPAPSAILDTVRALLPSYMVPSRVEVLDDLPRTSSGKLDRGRLAAPATRSVTTATAAMTPLEAAVARQMGAVLERADITAEDNFFNLGGDSLQANALLVSVMRAHDVELSLRVFLSDPTVRGLSTSVRDAPARADGAGTGAPGAANEEPLLSPPQEQLWYLEQIAPQSSAYNVPLALWVRGPLDVEAAERALGQVVARHDALRTIVTTGVDGGPSVHVAPDVDIRIEHEQAADEATAVRAATALARRPFDPSRPRLRGAVWTVDPERHLLVLVFHHLVCDGASLWRLLDELAAGYGGADGRRALLPPAPSFVDLVRRKRHGRSDAERAARVQEVVGRLSGVPPSVGAPWDRPRPARRTHAGALSTRALEPSLVAGVAELARKMHTTPAAVVLAAHAAALEWWSGEPCFAVSVPVADRAAADDHSTIGFLVNSVPVPLTVGRCRRFIDLLEHARDQLAFAWEHHDVAFEDVVRAARPARVPGQNPICQWEFAVQSVPDPLPQLGPAGLDYVFLHNGAAKFDVSLDVVERGDSLTLAFEYATELFDATTVDRLADGLVRTLEAVVDDPGVDLGRLALVPAPAPPIPPAPIPAAVPVLDRIEAQFAARPAAIAVVDDTSELRYADLDACSARVAHALVCRGIGPGCRVGVLMERSTVAIAAIVGVWRAGASFVPVAVDAPPAHVDRLVGTAGCAAVITVPEAGHRFAACPTLLVGPDDACWATAPEADPPRDHVVAPAGEAYLIHTSGSTGEPRGVAVTLEGLATITAAWGTAYDLVDAPGRHLQMAPMSFDVFIGDLTRALCFGGTLVVCDRRATLDPARLLAHIRRHDVDTGEFVPAVVRLLVDHLEATGETLDPLRRIIVGSDTWSMRDARRLIDRAPGARVICSYGTTESTIDSTFVDLTAEALIDGTAVPIGRPFPGVLVDVRDARGRPVPAGSQGELWVGGSTVSYGYPAEPELTADRFVTDGAGAERRWYRTGDRVRRGPDGLLHLEGRIDDQLKVHGVRVEPTGIEARIEAEPGVDRAAVVAAKAPDGTAVLAAFVVASPGEAPDVGSLEQALGRALPALYVPTRWELVDAIPLLPNGKIDRKTLSGQALAARPGRAGEAAPAEAAASPLEAVVARTWAEVLGLARVAPEDDFFALGGSSVQAARLSWLLGQRLRMDVDVGQVVEAGTVRRLCHRLLARSEGSGSSRLDAELVAVRLPDDLRLPATRARHPARSVLLTGATGFVGSAILKALSGQGLDRIVCMTRDPSPAAARARLREAVGRHGPDGQLVDQVETVRLDLGRPDTPLTGEDLARLTEVDAVVNAAAAVNFAYPYHALAAVNVDAVPLLLGLVGKERAVAFHQVSSLSAVPAPGHQPDGGYNRTKFAAELLLRQAAERGFGVSIHRPGFIGGAPGGMPPASHQLLWAFLGDCAQRGEAPDLDGWLDIVPVDVVAEAVVAGLGCPPDLVVRSYGNPAPMRWRDVFAWLQDEEGYRLDVVGEARWRDRLFAWVDEGGRSPLEPFLGLLARVELTELLCDDPRDEADTAPGCPPLVELWPAYCRQLRRGGLLPGETT